MGVRVQGLGSDRGQGSGSGVVLGSRFRVQDLCRGQVSRFGVGVTWAAEVLSRRGVSPFLAADLHFRISLHPVP